MASLGLLDLQISVQDPQGAAFHRAKYARFTPLAPNGVVQSISLAGSTFTALTVPTGAKRMAIFLNGATLISLKGVTGDAGISLVGATADPADVVYLPINTTVIGLLNSLATAQVVEVVFF